MYVSYTRNLENRRLHVLNLSGETLCTVSIHCSGTIRDLKALIEASTQIRPAEQRLVSGVTELTAGMRLGEVLPKGASDIILIRRELEQAKWLETVEANGYTLRDAPHSLRADPEVVLAAVSSKGRAIQYADAELWGDRAIAKAAIEQDPLSFQFISTALQGDLELALIAVHKDWSALAYMSAELRSDRQVADVALGQSWRALMHLGEEFKSDRSRILATVRAHGQALEFADEHLRADLEVVDAAVTADPAAFKFAAPDLREDRRAVLEFTRRDGRLLQYVPDAFRGDLEVVTFAVQQYGGALEFATEALRGDPIVVRQALSQNVVALDFASEELLKNREFVLAALLVDAGALAYASPALRYDDFFLSAAKQKLPFISRHGVVCQIHDTFEDFGLNKLLLGSFFAYGLQRPTDLHRRVLGEMLGGRGVVIEGSGAKERTEACIVGILRVVDLVQRTCQALILTPTDILARQMHDIAVALGSPQCISCCACEGTYSDETAQGSHLVIGTPDRTLQMIRAGSLQLDNLKALVVDQDDEVVSQAAEGFVDAILGRVLVSSCLQLSILSPTRARGVGDLAKRFSLNPEPIRLRPQFLTLEGIKQFYVRVEREEWKFETLCDLINDVCRFTQVLIYCNVRRSAQLLADSLFKRNLTASTACKAKGRDQELDKANRDFRCGSLRIFVTCDSDGAGVDHDSFALTLNYDAPRSWEILINRMGRSGKFGRKRMAINLLTDADVEPYLELEQRCNIVSEELPAEFLDLL